MYTYNTILGNIRNRNLDALADTITYDPKTKRYRYKGSNKPGEPITGSFVSRAEVIKLQKRYLEKVKEDFIALVPRILSNEIGIYRDAGELLKKIHLSQAIIASNGIDNLTNSQLGSIGAILKKQYYSGKDEKTGKPYGLKHLFKDVQNDPNYSEAWLRHRLELYAESGEITASLVNQSKQVSIGMRFAKRILGDAEHCEDCIRYAGLGWQIIGNLPLPKQQCECRNNCKCSIIYSEKEED